MPLDSLVPRNPDARKFAADPYAYFYNAAQINDNPLPPDFYSLLRPVWYEAPQEQLKIWGANLHSILTRGGDRTPEAANNLARALTTGKLASSLVEDGQFAPWTRAIAAASLVVITTRDGPVSNDRATQ